MWCIELGRIVSTLMNIIWEHEFVCFIPTATQYLFINWFLFYLILYIGEFRCIILTLLCWSRRHLSISSSTFRHIVEFICLFKSFFGALENALKIHNTNKFTTINNASVNDCSFVCFPNKSSVERDWHPTEQILAFFWSVFCSLWLGSPNKHKSDLKKLCLFYLKV